jgi:hypothetical protein
LREAFVIATSNAAAAEPADFFHDTTSEDWKTESGIKHYQWCGAEGASPFAI